MAGNWWEAGGAAGDQLRGLYGGAGKTGNLIDQEGWNYWLPKLQAGENIAPAFGQSVNQVYSDTLAGKASPYTAQNQSGLSNMMGKTSLPAYSPSPYLNDQLTGLQGRFKDQLNDSLQGLESGAIAAGGYGGARDMIGRGEAIGRSNTGFADAATGLLSNDYQQQMQRNLGQYGIDKNYDVSMGGLALGNKTADNNYDLGNRGLDNQLYGMDQNFYLGNQGQNQNFYTQQRGQDLESVRTGAALFGAGNQGEFSGIQNASSIYSPYTGYGNTTTNGGSFDWSKAIGDGLSTYQRLRV